MHFTNVLIVITDQYSYDLQMAKIIKVAIPAPLFGHFDYLNIHDKAIEPGCRVNVQFGRRHMLGVVVGSAATSNIDPKKLRKITRVIDAQPVVSEKNLQLAHWLAGYYHHPLGEVIFAMLPHALRQGNCVTEIELTQTGREILSSNLRAKKQLELCNALAERTQIRSDLRQNFSSAIIKACFEKNYIQEVASTITVSATIDPTLKQAAKTANDEQLAAIEAIAKQSDFGCFLLFGITGSGKTEIYLQSIQKVLQKNMQALILVPEISLTAQTINRFKQRFNTTVTALNSSLTNSARFKNWKLGASAQAGIVIGTRSAIFAELPRLGIIIIDEEHDESYKQQSNLKYHARDVAIWRAKNLDIPIILGSATPSLESWQNIERKNFSLLTLSQRAQNSILPTIKIIDQRGLPQQKILHDDIISHCKNVIENGKQILFFLNRRGYSEVCLCFNCGHEERCTSCDGRLILHKNPPRLSCHRCDKRYKFHADCQKCAQSQIQGIGIGTQQLEAILQQRFPGEKTIRIDRDTTGQRGSLDAMLKSAHQNEAKILIGTQMLAKGHDFDNLDSVVIINADCGLFSTDFRAEENLAQLISQVSGRAGRRNTQGSVLIQTLCPDNPLWEKVQRNCYSSIAQGILSLRQDAMLPPFTHQVLISCEDNNKQKAEQRLGVIAAQALAMQQTFPLVQISSPQPAPIARIKDKYRWQLWLQSGSRSQMHTMLSALASNGRLNGVQIDVTPLQIM